MGKKWPPRARQKCRGRPGPTARTAPRAYTLRRLPQQSQGRTCLRCDLVRRQWRQRRTGAISVRCGLARLGAGGVCTAFASPMKDTREQTARECS